MSHSIEVMIETPKGSRNKYVYDEERKQMRLKKILPEGLSFPFDFGFIPGTLAGDGDPLDVILLVEEQIHPGVVLDARVIGAIRAKQEKVGKMVRNDRIVAVAEASLIYSHIKDLNELNHKLVGQWKHFFASYLEQEGKQVAYMNNAGAGEAMQLIRSQKK